MFMRLVYCELRFALNKLEMAFIIVIQGMIFPIVFVANNVPLFAATMLAMIGTAIAASMVVVWLVLWMQVLWFLGI